MPNIAEINHQKALEAERKAVKDSERLAPYLDRFDQSALSYINAELAKDTREPEDVAVLRSRRRELLRYAERKAARA